MGYGFSERSPWAKEAGYPACGRLETDHRDCPILEPLPGVNPNYSFPPHDFPKVDAFFSAGEGDKAPYRRGCPGYQTRTPPVADERRTANDFPVCIAVTFTCFIVIHLVRRLS